MLQELEVQKYLRNQNCQPIQALALLNQQFAIKTKLHDDGRVILDYDMIESPKSHEITRECRGLVLDYKNNFDMVARGFRRFFNAGEHPADDKKFNWDMDVLCTHKEDGSFILLYHFQDKWRVNTRFSFADSLVNNSPFTWEDLVKQAFNYEKAPLLLDNVYLLELCTPYNKVVRWYPNPKVYLLSIFNRSNNFEFGFDVVSQLAGMLGIEVPDSFLANDIFDVQAYIAKVAQDDATFEGIVVRDTFNNRLKLKSSLYLHLHRLANNGNVTSVKNLVPLILAGETDEVLTYFKELEPHIRKIEDAIAAVKREVDNVWFCHYDAPSQAQFAKAITKDTKYTAPLFSARKEGNHPHEHLTSDYLLKYVFKDWI